jgi:hypothetical protein
MALSVAMCHDPFCRSTRSHITKSEVFDPPCKHRSAIYPERGGQPVHSLSMPPAIVQPGAQFTDTGFFF